MNQLYVLAQEFKQAAESLADADMPEDVIRDTLESISGDLETKCTNVAMLIRNLESQAEQIKAAEQKMAARRKALEKKAESISHYLFSNMQLAHIREISCPYFVLKIKKNPPKLVIEDESIVPDQFMVAPPPTKKVPDNASIKDAIKSGAEVPGCRLVQEERLEIK